MSTMWILRRPSTASTENVYGAYSGHIEFHSRLSLSLRAFITNFKCRVENSESSFDVKTGVRRKCPMSALLFNLAIDWVMGQTTSDRIWGIRWTLLSTLEDLDFADDLALLSHTIRTCKRKPPVSACFTTSRPEDQPEEHRSDDAKCLKPLVSQSIRRRSSDNRRIHLPW